MNRDTIIGLLALLATLIGAGSLALVYLPLAGIFVAAVLFAAAFQLARTPEASP